jgi:hypothetical protein
MSFPSLFLHLSLQIQATPAVPTADGGIRSPRCSYFDAGRFVGQFFEAVQIFDRTADSQIIHRKHVEPAEREDQKHFGSPSPNALYLRKHFDNGFIGQSADPVQSHGSIERFLGQIMEIRRLLPRQSHGSKIGTIEAGQIFGIYSFWLQQGIQPASDISSGGTRNLLGNDGPYQDRESVSCGTQVEWANSIDHFPYDPIFAEVG